MDEGAHDDVEIAADSLVLEPNGYAAVPDAPGATAAALPCRLTRSELIAALSAYGDATGKGMSRAFFRYASDGSVTCVACGLHIGRHRDGRVTVDATALPSALHSNPPPPETAEFDPAPVEAVPFELRMDVDAAEQAPAEQPDSGDATSSTPVSSRALIASAGTAAVALLFTIISLTTPVVSLAVGCDPRYTDRCVRDFNRRDHPPRLEKHQYWISTLNEYPTVSGTQCKARAFHDTAGAAQVMAWLTLLLLCASLLGAVALRVAPRWAPAARPWWSRRGTIVSKRVMTGVAVSASLSSLLAWVLLIYIARHAFYCVSESMMGNDDAHWEPSPFVMIFVFMYTVGMIVASVRL
jgi:hypothetical protein